VVDNGSVDGTAEVVGRFPGVELIPLPRNEGFSRAVNRAAAAAEGDAIVLVNDDCVCSPGFAGSLAAAIDPARSLVMAAGVLVEEASSDLIDSAGIELDSTLLVLDYLNGEPLAVLGQGVEPPVGPAGAAAAFDRAAFLAAGGFDEALFAYWEDVDLVLRLRLDGARCALVPEARAVHEHSATLGSGSARKNYLTGFGRGYVFRKWSGPSARRLPRAVAYDLLVCAGQAVVDRNLAGLRGRAAGFRAAADAARYDFPLDAVSGGGMAETLRRRLSRRARLRRQ
jgi:GT2 family glycosyltransferase